MVAPDCREGGWVVRVESHKLVSARAHLGREVELLADIVALSDQVQELQREILPSLLGLKTGLAFFTDELGPLDEER